jgi:phosphopantetheinyl transferase
MPRLYLCPLDGIDDSLLSRLLLALPAARRARALRYRRKERTVECAVAYHLVRLAACELCGKPPSPEWGVTPQGKPFFTPCGPFFSISHTRHGVAVALSTHAEVGVDIEILRPIAPRTLARIATEEELRSASLADDPFFGITLWSAKEAEGKRLGTGLENPRSLSLTSTAAATVTVGGVPHVLSLSPAAVLPAPRIISPEQLLF